MTPAKALTIIKWLLTRTIILYAAIFVLTLSLVNIQSVKDRIKVRRLNDTRPDMSQLVQLNKGSLSADKITWNPYIRYFSLVIKYMPFEKVSRMFLGYCEYFAGDTNAAWENIHQAADEPPLIYWGSYNAGLLAFERGDIANAIRYLERCVATPTEVAESGIASSIIYRQVMAASTFNASIPAEINRSRENLYLFLSAAYYYAKDYEKSKNIALYAIQQLKPKDTEPFFFFAGASCLAMKDLENALTFLSQCIMLRSQNPLAYFHAAEILKAMGKTEDAKRLYGSWETLKEKRPSGFPYPEKIRLRIF
jgi:tetratricopeptide (TPR) repeat protein